MSGDMMGFPDNWRTFVQQYQFADKEETYTNGSMLIPSFRVRQMVEHYFGGEVGKTNHHYELFGTPERAARTLAMQCFGATWEACDTCVFGECDGKLRNSGAYSTVYDTLLEWLGGNAE